jgi:4-hydroxythreonine-4-phosphate dehydrogenase
MNLSTSTTRPDTAHDPSLPLLITMGDICGIGPEIIAKAFQSGAAQGAVVVGDVGVMQRAAQALGTPCAMCVMPVNHLKERVPAHCIPVWQAPNLPPDLWQIPLGQIDARAGHAAYACITQAVRLVQSGQSRAIVTAPIHKAALAAAQIGFPGHTEILQALATPAGATPPAVRMMLANHELRTVLVTVHVALRLAIEAITVDAVLQTIQIAHHAAVQMGMGSDSGHPRLAVAGLNPHAGEGGLFGEEEINTIIPAVQAAQALGIQVSGPYAPDTVFMRARNTADHPGEFDIVVAMTHDHGLIPVKYLGIAHGVNLTLGLPFVRTSPDHGTAFDLAGKGLADPASLIAAIGMARSAEKSRQ